MCLPNSVWLRCAGAFTSLSNMYIEMFMTSIENNTALPSLEVLAFPQYTRSQELVGGGPSLRT